MNILGQDGTNTQVRDSKSRDSVYLEDDIYYRLGIIRRTHLATRYAMISLTESGACEIQDCRLIDRIDTREIFRPNTRAMKHLLNDTFVFPLATGARLVKHPLSVHL